ncbi:MAG: hypothetical protein AB4050_16325 [Synechococcus sp.]
MNLFRKTLFRRALGQVGRRLSGWQDVGYVTILVLSALSAIAFLGEYQAYGEPDTGVAEPVPVHIEGELSQDV